MTIAQEISVDIFEEKYFEYLNVKQADNVGRVLITTITAKDETLKPDKDTEQAVFRALKPDGTSVIDPATIREDGKVEIALSAQTLACDGQVEADISIIRGKTILSTATFYIQVARAPLGKTIKSENEFLLLIEAKDAAEDAAKRAEAAAEQTAADKQAASELAEQAAGSAGAAAGSASQAAGSEKTAGEHATAAEIAKALAEAAALLAQSWARGETGSRDGEDEDNAKYYAAQALIAALQAAEAAEDAQRVAQGAVGYYKTPELLREKHPSAEDGNWAIVGSTDTIWVWDSDSGDWTNSGNKIDLSQYYTRTEVDDLLTGLEEKMTEDLSAATSKLYTVTVPASGWTAPVAPAPTWQGKTAKWVNTVSVPGMTETANIPQGCVSFASGSYTAAEQWTWLEQGTDTVTFYADGAAAPPADFTLRLTEVR